MKQKSLLVCANQTYFFGTQLQFFVNIYIETETFLIEQARLLFNLDGGKKSKTLVFPPNCLIWFFLC